MRAFPIIVALLLCSCASLIPERPPSYYSVSVEFAGPASFADILTGDPTLDCPEDTSWGIIGEHLGPSYQADIRIILHTNSFCPTSFRDVSSDEVEHFYRLARAVVRTAEFGDQEKAYESLKGRLTVSLGSESETIRIVKWIGVQTEREELCMLIEYCNSLLPEHIRLTLECD